MTTWHGFARAILEELPIAKPVVPILNDQQPRMTKRPPNGSLDARKLERDFGHRLARLAAGLGLCVADFLESRADG